MMKFKFSVSILLITVMAITGCNKKPPDPTPPETVLGSGSNPRTSWVDDTQFSDSTGAGANVPTRDESGFLATGDHIAGILPSVHFDYDQAVVSPAERGKLKQAAEHLLSNSGDNLLIEGHCDWRGTYEYNLGLGDRRANGVKEYLVTLGVDASRMETLSKGDLDAITEGSEEQMSNDRRADLIIVR